MKKNLLIVLFISIFIWNCSSKETQKDDEKIVNEEEVIEDVYEPTIYINVDRIYCWIDLMPKIGGEQKKFHITGELTLPESDEYELQNLSLERIKVFQKNKLVYSINPTVRENELSKNKDERVFLFSTIRGLTLTPELIIEEAVDVEFIFAGDSENYTYKVFDQSIDKVH